MNRRHEHPFLVGNQNRDAIGRPDGHRATRERGPTSVGFRPGAAPFDRFMNNGPMDLSKKKGIVPFGRRHPGSEPVIDPSRSQKGMVQKH
jgi:hypothetical protein